MLFRSDFNKKYTTDKNAYKNFIKKKLNDIKHYFEIKKNEYKNYKYVAPNYDEDYMFKKRR